MQNYFEWLNFKNIYLEDSFVKSIKENKDQISFLLDVVLLEEHELYTKPIDNEIYCYKDAWLVFKNVTLADWIKRNNTKSIDINDDVDYGNIDALFYDRNGYNIYGDWGHIFIQSNPPELFFDKNII